MDNEQKWAAVIGSVIGIAITGSIIAIIYTFVPRIDTKTDARAFETNGSHV